MLSLAFLLAIATQDPNLSIPAAYYSLKELGVELKKQGVEVQIGSDVESDIYALRLENQSWPAIRAALTQDQRLEFAPQENGLILRRRPDDRTGTQRQFVAYMNAYSTTVKSAYTAAANGVAELLRLSPEGKGAYLKKLAAADPKSRTSPGAGPLILRFSGSGEKRWSEIGIPWQLSSRPPFSRPVYTNVYDARYALFPAGNLSGLVELGLARKGASEGDLLRLSRALPVAAKVALDPITLNSTYVLSIDATSLRPNLALTLRGQITPNPVNVSISPETLWTGNLLTELRRRRDLMSEGSDTLGEPLSQLAPASQALLHWAKATNASLVCFVSPMTDFSVSPGATASLDKVLAATNTGEAENELARFGTMERTGAVDSLYSGPGMYPAPRLTISKSDVTFVVRNEWTFLDQSVAAPSFVTSSLLNQLAAGATPTVSEIATAVARLSVGSWKSGVFTERDLTFCNPISFRPIALAYQSAPAVRKAFADLTERQRVSLTLEQMGGRATADLLRGLTDSAPICESPTAAPVGPLMAAKLWNSSSAEPRTLEISLVKGTHTISLQLGKTAIWTTWLRNVSTVK